MIAPSRLGELLMVRGKGWHLKGKAKTEHLGVRKRMNPPSDSKSIRRLRVPSPCGRVVANRPDGAEMIAPTSSL